MYSDLSSISLKNLGIIESVYKHLNNGELGANVHDQV